MRLHEIRRKQDTPAETYITQVYRRLKRLGHENIVVYLEPEGDQQVSIDSIDASVPGQGYGEKAIKIMTTSADRLGITLTLDVSSDEEDAEDERLVRWYQRHGFTISETSPYYHSMVRRPAIMRHE